MAVRIIKRGMMVGLGVILFLLFCPVKFAKHCYERFFINAPGASPVFYTVYAETCETVDGALKTFFPEMQSFKEDLKTLTAEQKTAIAKKADIEFDPELDKEYCIYTAQGPDGQRIGYAATDSVKGKWGVIHYIAAFDPDGRIKDVIVLQLLERRGRPVKERRFLNQFIGKSVSDPIKLNKDIKGVAGATVSSRGMANGLRKLVNVFNELYKK